MKHAAELDLAHFEDPAFHDVLERARQQATDRIGMLNSMGRLVLQIITLVSLSIGVVVVLALVVPAAGGLRSTRIRR